MILEAKCRDCGEIFNPASESDLEHGLRDDEQTACGGQGELLGGYERAAVDTRQYPFPMTRGEAVDLRQMVGEECERIIRETDDTPEYQEILASWESFTERLDLFIEANFADEIAEEAQRYDEEDARRRRTGVPSTP